MGKVRPLYIKKLARKIVEEFEPYLTLDFEENKQFIQRVVVFQSKRYRNRVVGYVTRLMKQKAREQAELDARTD